MSVPSHAAGPDSGARVAYFRGQDAFGLERAVIELAARLGPSGEPLDVWQASTEDQGAEAPADLPAARRRDRILGEIENRIATAPLFGGGTLVVVRQPEPLTREKAARDRLLRLVEGVPAGNGLCFVDLLAAGGRAPAATAGLYEAVERTGGVVREFPVPGRERMEAWIAARGAELGITFAPGAARLLTERIGGYVREADIDRRRQTELADQELQKLALYRPEGTITRHDVAELVTEAVPGSAWAFLDAVGARRPADAAMLAERLLADAVPVPVLISQLQRRLRELVIVRDHLDSGTRGPALMRAMRLQPYRAQKLQEQGLRWSFEALKKAIDGLVELDLASKGITLDGSTRQMSPAWTALGIQRWLAEAIGPLGSGH